MPNLYHETAEPRLAGPPLHGEGRADVIVVGGGITGLSAALHLAEAGRQVALLESHTAGWGASGRNGGQVNPGLKWDPDEVERRYGEDLGGRMNALAGGAPRFVFDLVGRLRIACQARNNGTLRAASSARQAQRLRQTAAQLARRGAPMELLEGAELARAIGTQQYTLALLDRRGGDLHPLRYAQGLAAAARAAGAVLHENSRALELRRSGGLWHVSTASGSLAAPAVLLATNGYTDGLWPSLRKTIVPLFGAIAASAPLEESVAREILPARSVLYEIGAITHYYRIDMSQRLLFGGRGPMREVSDTAEIQHLLAYARRLFPSIEGLEWTHVWGGQMAMTTDHYPHIHEPEAGVTICLGYNGRGVAMATVMGAQLAGRIADRSARFDMPVSAPRNIPLHGLWRSGVRAAILRGRFNDWLGR